jgi:hypothetical protein
LSFEALNGFILIFRLLDGFLGFVLVRFFGPEMIF